jgi:membrane protease YdiL (CAAX protease family)
MTATSLLLLGLSSYAAIAWLAARALARRGHVLSRGPARPLDAGALGIAAVANVCIGVSVLVEHTVLAGRTLASLGLTATAAHVVACAFVVVVCGLFAASFARWRTGTARPSAAAHGRTLAVALIALAGGAWMEEVLFRAFAFAWLAPHGAAFALVVSSIVFTLVHVPTSRTDRWALLDWFVGGLVLGGIYLATGSVWVATTAHLSRNVGNVLWVEAATDGSPVRWPRSGYYAALGAATLAVACALR